MFFYTDLIFLHLCFLHSLKFLHLIFLHLFFFILFLFSSRFLAGVKNSLNFYTCVFYTDLIFLHLNRLNIWNIRCEAILQYWMNHRKEFSIIILLFPYDNGNKKGWLYPTWTAWGIVFSFHIIIPVFMIFNKIPGIPKTVLSGNMKINE